MSVPSSLRSSSAVQTSGVALSGSARAGRRCATASHEQRRPARKFEPGEAGDEAPVRSAMVVFADHADCPWLRPLRRGFRHCFVVLRAGSVWLACDPLKDRIELEALELPGKFDLAAFYREQGHQVLVGEHRLLRTRRRFALTPLTCVTVVKRLLGINAPWVWTPWQLYTYLSASEYGFESKSGATPGPELRDSRDA
jgi:hypothetical protein